MPVKKPFPGDERSPPVARRFQMRSFVLACIAVAVIAAVSAAVLSVFQEPAQVAFSTDAVRL
jgi:hypothetical protein